MGNRTVLINIGNTHTQIAAVGEDNTPRLLETLDTPALISGEQTLQLDNSSCNAVAVSVVPRLTEILGEQYGERIRFLSVKDFPILDFSAVDTSTLGMDRVANAAAAYNAIGSAVAVIDFGTCINTVIVDCGGRFRGGAILPGRMLLRKTLAVNTAQLPLLPMREECPPPLGGNTLDAIAAGVDCGVIGTVRRIIEETRKFLGVPDCPFITAGGDAPFFLSQMQELTKGPELLTIRGIMCSEPFFNHQ